MVKEPWYDVVFFEAFEEEQALLKKFLPTSIKALFVRETIQETSCQQLPAPIVSIRTQSHIPDAWAQKMQAVLTRSTGYDHLLAFFKKTSTSATLGYLPCYCARAVAEQAILLALGLLRKIKKQTQQFLSFDRDGLTGLECKAKNLLVIGVGNIGKQIVDIGLGLRMSVAGVDICQKVPSLKYLDLQQGLEWADVVICAASLTSRTNGMLSYKTLSSVKKGSIFVNIARGEIAPLSGLVQLLDEEILSGVALDVFTNEKQVAVALRNKDNAQDLDTCILNALSKRDNVLLTPHNAFNTRESIEQKALQSIDSIKMFLEKKTFLFTVPTEEEC